MPLPRPSLGPTTACSCFALPHPPCQVLEEYDQAGPEEREELYGGGTPYSPFLAMLQVGGAAWARVCEGVLQASW